MMNFRKRRLDFNEVISVTGHSLGAATNCYDLICPNVHDDHALLESDGVKIDF